MSSSSDAASSSSTASSAVSDSSPAEKKRAKRARTEGQKVVSSSESDASDADESSSASSSSEKKKKLKKKKKKKLKKDRKQGKKKDKESKKGGKVKKKDKKTAKGKKAKKLDKKAKKHAKATRDAVSTQFGKYGVIKAEDFYSKKPEFLCWAMEVKKESTDSMGQMEMKNLFKEFIEDFNTATMPSKKYYNLQAWDVISSKKRQTKKRGDEMTDSQKAALASFDDEKARREEIKHLQAKKQEDLITNEVRKMRADKTKVNAMKTQDRLRTHMDMLSKTGNTKEADKIAQRLDPSKEEPVVREPRACG